MIFCRIEKGLRGPSHATKGKGNASTVRVHKIVRKHHPTRSLGLGRTWAIPKPNFDARSTAAYQCYVASIFQEQPPESWAMVHVTNGGQIIN